jgi:hypothetical protein
MAKVREREREREKNTRIEGLIGVSRQLQLVSPLFFTSDYFPRMLDRLWNTTLEYQLRMARINYKRVVILLRSMT